MHFKDTMSTNTSQKKIEIVAPAVVVEEEEKPQLKIEDFKLGKKLGAGKFG